MQNMITIRRGDPGYPSQLAGIPSPPETLYCIGRTELLGKRCLAVVGSRKTTPYGRNTAREIAGKMAQREAVVVSGMAAGIDTCAHEGALNAGGDTIAVLGSGPDICYPKMNERLMATIMERGLIVSEYPPGTEPKPYHFPLRNRIISGLSEAVVVVQAGMKSGAVITAELAMEQGREVFAVPGNIDSQYNLGSNKLLRDGAEIVLTAGDLMDRLSLGVLTCEEARNLMGNDELEIYTILGEHGEMTIDQMAAALGKGTGAVTKTVAIMELKGLLFSDMGKIFIAKYNKTTYNQ